MVDENLNISIESARAFFKRAEEVASADNFDYAIELYIGGIKKWPEAIEEGHQPLMKLALLRSATGGKKPSIKDRLTKKDGKDAIDELAYAEYLLAKDPDNINYAEMVINAARKGGYNKLVAWMSRRLLSHLKSMDKRPYSTLMTLIDSFAGIELYEEAVLACRMAKEAKPSNLELDDEMKNLMAKQTILKGRYDSDEGFTKSIKNREAQEALQQKDAIHKTVDFKTKEVQELEMALNKTPNSQSVRLEYAKKASKLGDAKLFMDVCKKLDNWYHEDHDFSYQKMLGEIIISNLRDKIRTLKHSINENGKDEKSIARLRELTNKLFEAEIQHFKGCVENYPTELKYTYELGTRLMHKKQFDEAIPLFQKSQKRPALKVASMNMLGMCFFNKGWFSDAIDIFTDALKNHPSTDDDIYKETRYNLARAFEHEGKLEDALEIYRRLAQLDFSFRDVSERVNKIRENLG